MAEMIRQELFRALMRYLETYSREVACAEITAYMTDAQLKDMVRRMCGDRDKLKEDKPMVKSFKPVVKTSGDTDWVGNALRFATYEEAMASVKNLAARWLAVIEYDVQESDDPVNYRWIDGHMEAVKAEANG